MTSRQRRRIGGLAIAIGLNVLLGWMLSRGFAFWRRGPLRADGSVSVMILLDRVRTPRVDVRSAPALDGNGQAILLPAPSMPGLTAPSVPMPSVPEPAAKPPPDWALEAQRGAQSVLARERFDEQQRRKIGGGIPLSNFEASRGHQDPQRPLFAWGHQPISKGFDAAIDEKTKLPYVSLGPCQIVLVWVFPAFACSLPSLQGSEELEAAFDPGYRPNAVDIPKPLITVPEPAEHAPPDTSSAPLP